MNVTPARRAPGRLPLTAGLAALLLALAPMHGETFLNLETVDTNGMAAWNANFPVTLVGVLLTDPGEMLDATPNLIP